MAPAPVAVHIDHDIALVLVAKVDRKPDNLGRGFRVLAIDVQDRHTQHLRNRGGVDRRSGLPVGRRKSDLVVDDDVNRAADGVARQLAHVECFLHDPFSSKRGVPVKQDAETMVSLGVAFAVLPGPHAADGDRIDVFEVARIETQ